MSAHASDALRLGSFDLIEPLGRGAQAEVWLGHHRPSGDYPVAIKLFRPTLELDDQAADRLQVEIRAAASLDHPGVVAILDEGEVGLRDADGSGGVLQPGQRFLVMEHVRGRTLLPLLGTAPWARCRDVLIALLGALAHAHARGVIHRDIKGGNVLLDAAGAVKLADFGVAELVGMGRASGVVAGTPAYMAPEQWTGDSLGQGPWTDLYALGCLAYALVAGAPPFGRSGTLAAFGARHLFRAPPEFPARADLPPGLWPWLRRLLAKDPARRFRTAAAAATALRGLESPASSGAAVWTPTPTAGSRPRTMHLVGAGLGLLALRRPRLVGRDVDLGRIWADLRAVCDDGGVRHVALAGEAGVGRSALLSSIADRAHETGVALPLRLGAGDALWQAPLEELLGVAGVEPELRTEFLVRRSEQAWPDSEWAPRIRVLFAERPWPPQGSLAHEKFVLDILTAWSRERPILLLADDASEASLARLDALPASAPGLSALVLSAPSAAERAERGALRVEPLSPEHELRLLRDQGLDARLAARVHRLSAGNPGFALRLLGSWVDGGLLVPGKVGFLLAGGVDAEALSEDVALNPALGGTEELGDRTADERAAVEMAAVLGGASPPALWRAACLLRGLRPGPDLLHELVQRRVLRPAGVGFEFTRRGLVTRFRAQAAAAGRLRGHHSAAARALVARDDPDWEARGRHFLGAGSPEDAAGPLLRALGEHRAALRPLRCAAIADLVERCLQEADAAPADPRWFELWQHRAIIAIAVGDVDGQAHATGRCRRHTDASDEPLLEIECLRLEGSYEEFRGRTAAAARLLEEALRRARGLNSRPQMALCALRLGVVRARRGNFDASVSLLTEALALESPPPPDRIALVMEIYANLTHIYSLAGRRDEALEAAEEGLRIGRLAPFSHMHSSLLAIRGAVLAERGDIAAAERELEEARALMPDPGCPDAYRVELALAAVRLRLGRPAGVPASLRRVRSWCELNRAWPELLETEVLLLRASASLGDLGAAEDALAAAEALAGETMSRSPEILRSVRSAGRNLDGDLRDRCARLVETLNAALHRR